MLRKKQPERRPPTPASLFGMFFYLSAVTIGGGYAMVPVIGSSLAKRGWVEDEEFINLFSQAQSFPGPLAFTTALIAGRKLCGTRGAIAAGLGVVLPPFGAIILVGALIGRIGNNPMVRNFLAGAGATVPGLVAAMIWKVSKSRKWTAVRAISAIAVSVLLSLFSGLTLPIFFGSVILLYFTETRWKSST